MRTRRQTTWSALVAFVVTAALPGSGVHVHRHAGGEHAHVHADEELDADGPDAEDRDAHHHHRPDPSGRPILTDDDDAPAHVHVRSLFQRALPFALAASIVRAATPVRPTPALLAPPPRTLAAVRSRGPPPVARG